MYMETKTIDDFETLEEFNNYQRLKTLDDFETQHPDCLVEEFEVHRHYDDFKCQVILVPRGADMSIKKREFIVFRGVAVVVRGCVPSLSRKTCVRQLEGSKSCR